MRVYNIQVEKNNNFFAHGILVHNCICKITDESGAVMNCHVKNKIYPQYKDMLWSKVVGDDVLLFIGYVPGSTNYMIVKDIQEWNDRKAQDAKCYKCTLIKNAFCPASGNPNAKIVLVGMCPGYDEVNQKKPFVGKAGQILNKILKDIGINRDEDVFITNSALCRPVDGNKNIDPDEFQLACCHDRLFGEIKQAPRKVVVTFGKVAYYALTGENTKSITQISGTKIALEGYILIPTIHPAAALHQENEVEYKKLIKESLELAMDESGMNGDKVNVNCGYGNWKNAAYGELFPPSNNALPLTSSKSTSITGKKSVPIDTLMAFIPNKPLSTAPGVPLDQRFCVI
jgi:DNA polymerase